MKIIPNFLRVDKLVARLFKPRHPLENIVLDHTIQQEDPKKEENIETIRISPTAYLRAMFNIAWSAFRHPTKTTIIDLETGKIIKHLSSKDTSNTSESNKRA